MQGDSLCTLKAKCIARSHSWTRRTLIPDDSTGPKRNNQPIKDNNNKPPIDYILREREMGIEYLLADRKNSCPHRIWIFCAGPCTPTGSGEAAIISRGCSTYYFAVSHQSSGINLNTQMELEGIRMGLHMIDIFRHNWED